MPNAASERRTLLFYQFESGGSMRVELWGDVSTDDAIWALRELMAHKEREIAASAGQSRGQSNG
jgi:hypothetical protein